MNQCLFDDSFFVTSKKIFFKFFFNDILKTTIYMSDYNYEG